MTDTEIAPDHVDLSVEDDGGATSGAEYWAGQSAILQSPTEMPMDDDASPPPPPPPAPANERPEPLRFFVKLGHIFSGGPNGR